MIFGRERVLYVYSICSRLLLMHNMIALLMLF